MMTGLRRGLAVCASTSVALAFAGTLDARMVRDQRDPSRGGGAYRLEASAVFSMTLDFSSGQRRSCETRNRSPLADPVLHLLAPKTGNGVVQEVARDDDSAGDLNATFQLPGPYGWQV